MSFRWEEELEPEAELSEDERHGLGLGREFDTREDAESWLGESFDELADYGVASVSLYEDDELVYGPMGLGKQEE
ncbi:hypothetical protein [Propionibacterium australiense]|uniref:Uncharacterized protein n=1 Tax=Propionibacterium australiense TaxID=119981 RepID=A0A383S7Z7_9ACTN|nr:hypothetical protein [Propionibacterium australiense]RLP07974.1 hypothetical protein D7U36_10435 [Propionibacterium australiense]RLP08790.1 hypothetical protein D9T14_08255 [Propionibacterium australiense]SYZ33376.1 Hypothetical protein PROPAUS_1295 [Propionibacterium australiense]VEH89721.1 Uncharacterised protein [Propionibacterium australiense]